MTLLNKAHKIYRGAAAADQVYLGENKVWDKAEQFVWPNASNCGVPAGTVLTVDTRNGITDSNLVFEDVNFTDSIQYYYGAVGTTFRRCLFSGGYYFRLFCAFGGDLLFEDCTFQGSKCQLAVNCSGTFRRCKFVDQMLAITLQPGASHIEYNYIGGFDGPPHTHFDGMFIGGGQTDVVIKDNFIDMSSPTVGTGGIFIHTQFGPSAGPFLIEHNRIIGPTSFPVYTACNYPPDLGPCTLINNEIKRGDYGYMNNENHHGLSSGSGNVDAYTFTNIDDQMDGLVPI
jgi:hypothetical protein